jgi:hypothetical protein
MPTPEPLWTPMERIVGALDAASGLTSATGFLLGLLIGLALGVGGVFYFRRRLMEPKPPV